jgi:hypothetical protein
MNMHVTIQQGSRALQQSHYETGVFQIKNNTQVERTNLRFDEN